MVGSNVKSAIVVVRRALRLGAAEVPAAGAIVAEVRSRSNSASASNEIAQRGRWERFVATFTALKSPLFIQDKTLQMPTPYCAATVAGDIDRRAFRLSFVFRFMVPSRYVYLCLNAGTLGEACRRVNVAITCRVP